LRAKAIGLPQNLTHNHKKYWNTAVRDLSDPRRNHITLFHVGIGAIVMGVVALIAGILVLIGK